jgi:hypothetical protein
VVHRHVQVNLVAVRAEFRRLVAHERLEEGAAMRLRIQAHQEVVQPPGQRILARGQLVKLGIFEHIVALPHGAFHVHDAVAHHATQSGLRLGAIYDLLDGRVEHAAEAGSWHPAHHFEGRTPTVSCMYSMLFRYH